MSKSQLAAIKEGRTTYNSGKPCRAGHHSDRYTSNGMCIECTKQRNAATKEVQRLARIKHVRGMMAHLRPHAFMVREPDRNLVQRVCDILQYGSPQLVEGLTAAINQAFDVCPNPRALTRDDLLRFMRFENNVVTNYRELEIVNATDTDPHIYIMHNGQRYRGDECMKVLRGEKFNAIPK